MITMCQVIQVGGNMSNERLGMFEELAKAKGQLEGALALELIEKIRELEERLDRVRSLVDVMEQHGEADPTLLVQFREATDGELTFGDDEQ